MYTFTFSDLAADSGFGSLSAVPSARDSLLRYELDVTSSQHSNAAVGLYSLIPEVRALLCHPRVHSWWMT